MDKDKVQRHTSVDCQRGTKVRMFVARVVYNLVADIRGRTQALLFGWGLLGQSMVVKKDEEENSQDALFDGDGPEGIEGLHAASPGST